MFYKYSEKYSNMALREIIPYLPNLGKYLLRMVVHLLRQHDPLISKIVIDRDVEVDTDLNNYTKNPLNFIKLRMFQHVALEVSGQLFLFADEVV